MASMIPQRLLDLFEQVTARTRSNSTTPSPTDPVADVNETNHTLPASTRIVPFDNTAFLPPSPNASALPFPSTVCVSASGSLTIPPRALENTHLAEFVVAYLTSSSGDQGKLDDIVAGIAAALGIVPRGGPQEENVRERVAMFTGWMRPAQRVVFVAQDTNERIATGLSSANGISSDLRWVGRPTGAKQETVWRALTAPGDNRIFEMRTYFAGPNGWTVVSDVDDTVKVSQVNNRIALLRNTFVAEPSAVPGMPELYHSLDAKLNNPAWFYLSASPWQLYPFLHEFLTTSTPNTQTLFPRGQLVLRDMNRSAMPIYLSSLTMGTREYKFDRLTKIHGWMSEPNRRVLLIGDSTQTDPEAYGDAARKWPGWVGAIWIRVVKGVDESKEKTLNSPERFEKAFQRVDKSIWRTFQDAKELVAAAQGLKV
ncbi:hypothetical protein FRC09_009369 [Ceratobasidium sp. 395]|nr:hypothetical protein FRC09_009369 [Ceratobasidium sp. 395]